MLTHTLSPSLPTEVFEELTVAVQEKDSLASELHVRHIAIEQLFKNCAKLPWLHISRAGVKASSSGTVEWRQWDRVPDKHISMLTTAGLTIAFMYCEWLLHHQDDTKLVALL